MRRLLARLRAARRLQEQNLLLVRALLRVVRERDELRSRIEQDAQLGQPEA